MAEQHAPWPAAVTPPPGWLPPGQLRPPSGLFPGQPPRPRFREPYAIGVGQLFAGLGSGLIWMALFGALGVDLFSYAWWTVIAGVTAWIVSIVLGLLGDRGVAVGVAVTAGIGLSVAAAFVAARWISTNDWPMW